MGYYKTFLEKQKLKEEEEKKKKNRESYLKYKDKEYHKKNYEKQKEYARQYYWKNREYVLERQRAKKYETSQYYKEWYKNNRNELNIKRYGMDNKKSKSSSFGKITYVEPKLKKEYKPEDFILFGK
jgi:hypothetical protein